MIWKRKGNRPLNSCKRSIIAVRRFNLSPSRVISEQRKKANWSGWEVESHYNPINHRVLDASLSMRKQLQHMLSCYSFTMSSTVVTHGSCQQKHPLGSFYHQIFLHFCTNKYKLPWLEQTCTPTITCIAPGKSWAAPRSQSAHALNSSNSCCHGRVPSLLWILAPQTENQQGK